MESRFLDDMGSFRIEHGEKNRLNYFPLAAENGVMASITPELKGDLKQDQNSFVLPPASFSKYMHNILYIFDISS